MGFRDFPKQEQGIQLLQRSLERGRLGHAYLFTGYQLQELEAIARTLAMTLNCLEPVKAKGVAVDSCDECLACKKIEHENHADVFWVRPESKSRQIRIGQLVRRDDSPSRVLLDAVNLKPTESQFKVAVIVAADRMNEQAANAFLKTLEEPPPRSVLILLSTDPQRLLETIISRCLRLNFGAEDLAQLPPDQMDWLARFSQMASGEQKSLIGRYRLLDVLLKKLGELRKAIEETLTARSPLERYPDAEQNLRDVWEDELKAAIEAEYRRQRADLLSLLHWWLRDVWLRTLACTTALSSTIVSSKTRDTSSLLAFPQVSGAEPVALRINAQEARQNLEIMEELQRWLGSNVQEALALEVSLLKLRL